MDRPGRHQRAEGMGKALGHLAVLLLCGAAGLAQEPRQGWQGSRNQYASFLSKDDILLPLTSVEWGVPDRWSVTARYIHLFTKDRDRKNGPVWIHGFTATLSPGTDGGRLGLGYSGVHRGRVPVLPEARLVLLRTWGHPLQTQAGRNFLGPELRLSVVGVANGGVGWYRALSTAHGPRETFWGFHLGFGL